MSGEFAERFAKIGDTYADAASMYDSLVVQWRSHATKVEIFLMLLTTISGAGGVTGLFSVLSNMSIDPATGWWGYMGALWTAMPAIVSIAAAATTGYVSVVQPRQKQSSFGANSASCTALAAAARVVGGATLADVNDYKNALTATVTTMQNSVDMGLIPCEKKDE
jgi:hypothetical protein